MKFAEIDRQKSEICRDFSNFAEIFKFFKIFKFLKIFESFAGKPQEPEKMGALLGQTLVPGTWLAEKMELAGPGAQKMKFAMKK